MTECSTYWWVVSVSVNLQYCLCGSPNTYSVLCLTLSISGCDCSMRSITMSSTQVQVQPLVYCMTLLVSLHLTHVTLPVHVIGPYKRKQMVLLNES